MAVRHDIVCVRCGCTATRCRTGSVTMCLPCSHAHAREGLVAINRVGAAVRKGEMARAATFLCVDCGKQATEYEHRDYLKPLDVVPVCRPCNHKRGPAMDSRLRHFATKAQVADHSSSPASRA